MKDKTKQILGIEYDLFKDKLNKNFDNFVNDIEQGEFDKSYSFAKIIFKKLICKFLDIKSYKSLCSEIENFLYGSSENFRSAKKEITNARADIIYESITREMSSKQNFSYTNVRLDIGRFTEYFAISQEEIEHRANNMTAMLISNSNNFDNEIAIAQYIKGKNTKTITDLFNTHNLFPNLDEIEHIINSLHIKAEQAADEEQSKIQRFIQGEDEQEIDNSTFEDEYNYEEYDDYVEDNAEQQSESENDESDSREEEAEEQSELSNNDQDEKIIEITESNGKSTNNKEDRREKILNAIAKRSVNESEYSNLKLEQKNIETSERILSIQKQAQNYQDRREKILNAITKRSVNTKHSTSEPKSENTVIVETISTTPTTLIQENQARREKILTAVYKRTEENKSSNPQITSEENKSSEKEYSSVKRKNKGKEKMTDEDFEHEHQQKLSAEQSQERIRKQKEQEKTSFKEAVQQSKITYYQELKKQLEEGSSSNHLIEKNIILKINNIIKKIEQENLYDSLQIRNIIKVCESDLPDQSIFIENINKLCDLFELYNVEINKEELVFWIKNIDDFKSKYTSHSSYENKEPPQDIYELADQSSTNSHNGYKENPRQKLILTYRLFYGRLSEGFRAYYDDLSANKFDSVILASTVGNLLLTKLLPIERYKQLYPQPMTSEQEQELLFYKKQISTVPLELSKEHVMNKINRDQGIFDIKWLTEANPDHSRIAYYFSFTKDELLILLNNHLSHIKSKSDQSNKDYFEIKTLIQNNAKCISDNDTKKLYNIFSKYNIFLSAQEIESLFMLKIPNSISKEEQDFISSAADSHNFVKPEDTKSIEYSVGSIFKDATEDQEDIDLAAAIAASLDINSFNQDNNEVELISPADDVNSSD